MKQQRSSIYPPALKKGDTIGILSPSGWQNKDEITSSISYLKSFFNVKSHEQNDARYGQFAGKPQQKADALHDYFNDSSIKAIFCMRGGNGTVHLQDHLDYNLIRQNPKIFIGFSDATTLLNAIHQMTGLVTFHGPMLVNLQKIHKKHAQQMIETLMGNCSSVKMPDQTPDMSGRLLGGNLSAMQTLIGTPFSPVLDQAILMLEDINEHLSRYDRMIGHMKQAKWLKNLSGVLLGEFINSLDGDNPFGFSIEEIVANNAPNVPLATGAPFGHGKNLCTLPIGAECTLKNGTLSFNKLP